MRALPGAPWMVRFSAALSAFSAVALREVLLASLRGLSRSALAG